MKLHSPGVCRAALAALLVLAALGSSRADSPSSVAAAAAGVQDSALANTAHDLMTARKALATGARETAAAALRRAATSLPQIADATARGFQLLAYARGLRQLRGSEAPPTGEEYAALIEARHLADRLDSAFLRTYAAGYLGDLYQDQQRTAEAIQLHRQALFEAQAHGYAEASFFWHWRLARHALREGRLEAAVAEYRAATATLEPIRAALATRYAGQYPDPSDAHTVVYSELADLLLRQAPREADPARRRAILVDARAVLEKLKSAELEDYFQDQCVSALQARTQGIDAVDDRTAVIYPVLLPDRLEILLSSRGALSQYTVPASRRDVQAQVVKFRRALEKRTTREYLRYSQSLYRLLIGPLSAQLASDGVEALVFVPDDVFRMIPLAALHDGQAFLIERFGVAVTPGLTITDPTPLQLRSASLLAGGITASVQGFGALPNVAEELAAVGAAYPGTALVDNAFEPEALREALLKQPYRIVHLATHGEFGADARDNFILTWSQRITLPQLQGLIGATKFRTEPVDILTLSACNTAAGDARAALGLAGVAVQSGARSALATLWYVNDTASSLLVQTFYQQLGQSKATKAQALREAQRALLAEPRFRHPGYWSAFMLIGNWL